MAALRVCGAGVGNTLARRAPLGPPCDLCAAMVASSAAPRAYDSLDFHALLLLVCCDGSSFTGDLDVSVDFRDFRFNGGFYQLGWLLGMVSDPCDFDGVADLRVVWSATSSTTSTCCSTCTTVSTTRATWATTMWTFGTLASTAASTRRGCSRTWSLALLFLVYRGGYHMGELGNDYLDLRDFGYNGVFYQWGRLVGQVSGLCDFGGVAILRLWSAAPSTTSTRCALCTTAATTTEALGNDYLDIRDFGYDGDFYQWGQPGLVSGFCDCGGLANRHLWSAASSTASTCCAWCTTAASTTEDLGFDYLGLRDCGFNGDLYQLGLLLGTVFAAGGCDGEADLFVLRYCGGDLDDDLGDLWDFDFNGGFFSQRLLRGQSPWSQTLLKDAMLMLRHPALSALSASASSWSAAGFAAGLHVD
ncbi:unnamed protein product [Symbiodinium sp. CCMP2592]|nr:unnamed protein product [Symbiodinium sp. CCMP2592]